MQRYRIPYVVSKTNASCVTKFGPGHMPVFMTVTAEAIQGVYEFVFFDVQGGAVYDYLLNRELYKTLIPVVGRNINNV